MTHTGDSGSKSFKKTIVVIISLLIIYPTCLGILSIFISTLEPKEVVKAEVLAETVVNPEYKPKESLLAKVVEGQLEGTKGSYGIVILNLKNNEIYLAHEHRLYKAASLYKLWIMAVAYEQIRDGKLKENDVLSSDIGVLYARFNVATPSAQTQPQPTGDAPAPQGNGITLTVAEAIEKMVIISDNTSALLLSQKVGLTNVAAFLEKHGFGESKINTVIGYPVTTPYDMALFMKKLYKGELNNSEYTKKMLTLLKQQRLNGKLPKYLPEGTVIAHKTGELEDVTHDVGIVYTENGDYIICVLTESLSRLQAENRIANISEAVYQHFLGISNK